MGEALDRHDAVHAVGSVVMGLMYDMRRVRGKDAGDINAKYADELATLTPKAGVRNGKTDDSQMQVRTGAPAAETAALLDEFGMELSAGGLVVMTNFAKAENPYIHHSRVPVAVVAMALASPTFARGRFPKLRLVDVVAKTASMDGAEKRALAAVCGASVEGLPEGSGRAPAFAARRSRQAVAGALAQQLARG